MWTEAEHAALIPFGERIKAKETSYYRACMDLQFLLPGRSFQGIRAKLKYWVEYGVFGKNVC